MLRNSHGIADRIREPQSSICASIFQEDFEYAERGPVSEKGGRIGRDY
jgi:hypothetical protein